MVRLRARATLGRQRDEGGAGSWGEVKKLTASDAEFFDFFGQSVAVSGGTAVVGAPFEDAGGSFAGAAYVFQLPAPTPTPTDTPTPTPTNTSTPTPTDTPTLTPVPPTPIGGIGIFPDLAGTAVERPESSGPNYGIMGGAIAAVAAGALARAAWYARRRRR